MENELKIVLKKAMPMKPAAKEFPWEKEVEIVK